MLAVGTLCYGRKPLVSRLAAKICPMVALQTFFSANGCNAADERELGRKCYSGLKSHSFQWLFADVFGQLQPGIDNRIGVERNALNPFIHQPFGEIGMI